MASKEVENLVNLLGKYVDMYSEEEIIQAVIAEGYSRRIAKEVVEVLFKNKSKNQAKVEEKELTPASEPVLDNKEESSTDFGEVNNLLAQMKQNVSMPTSTEEIAEEVTDDTGDKGVVVPLQTKVEAKEENVQNQKDKDLSQVPRRLRRFYREPGSEEKLVTEDGGGERHYRDRLKALQEGKEESPIPVKDSIIDVIYNQVREKTDIDRPKEEIARIAEQEVDRFRNRHNREPNKREEINEVVDNIFTQLTAPDLQAEEEKKYAESSGKVIEDNETDEKQEKKETTNSFGMDLNLPDFNLGNKVDDSDLKDLDLNLDLSLEPKKEKKEEKKE
jgi:hypothetical protein